MTFCGNKLYSGGVDSYLACSYHPPKTVLKMPPILQSPCVHLATEARYLMLRYSKHVEVWTLGRSEDTDSNYRGLVTLKDEPKKLLVLRRITKDYDGDEEKQGVLFSCISSNGKWIIFSTNLGIRLFQFDYVSTAILCSNILSAFCKYEQCRYNFNLLMSKVTSFSYYRASKTEKIVFSKITLKLEPI